jgi:predicted transcriptional regulator/predicted RNase H-like HicB family nuclease
MRQYIALIHKDADSDFGVSFPDLPGCVTAGLDLDDARRMAEEALALHLAGMAEDEEPAPEPSSLEAVMTERENRDAVAILVKGPPATAKAIRVNMTIPEDELEQIDKFAAEHGYTRSGFLVHAAKTAIGEATGRWTRAATAAIEAKAPGNARLEPAVPPKKSISADYIVCLEDGRKFKSLKRHLRTQYKLSPEQYREKWGLPPDYPMVAPSYAKARTALAKQMGLGQQRQRRK